MTGLNLFGLKRKTHRLTSANKMSRKTVGLIISIFATTAGLLYMPIAFFLDFPDDYQQLALPALLVGYIGFLTSIYFVKTKR